MNAALLLHLLIFTSKSLTHQSDSPTDMSQVACLGRASAAARQAPSSVGTAARWGRGSKLAPKVFANTPLGGTSVNHQRRALLSTGPAPKPPPSLRAALEQQQQQQQQAVQAQGTAGGAAKSWRQRIFSMSTAKEASPDGLATGRQLAVSYGSHF